MIKFSFILLSLFSITALSHQFIPNAEIVCELNVEYSRVQDHAWCQSSASTGSGFGRCIRVEVEECRNSSGQTFIYKRRIPLKHCISVGASSATTNRECGIRDPY